MRPLGDARPEAAGSSIHAVRVSLGADAGGLQHPASQGAGAEALLVDRHRHYAVELEEAVEEVQACRKDWTDSAVDSWALYRDETASGPTA